MIFNVLRYEKTLQVNDKTRLDAYQSFAINPITLIEINPDFTQDALNFIDITPLKYLDWAYTSSGSKLVHLRVTSGINSVTTVYSINVLSVSDDKLISDDNDLIVYENDIFKYLRDGRSSFLDIHREARNMIIKWFDEQRITNNGVKLTIDNFSRVDELKSWSKFKVLRMIFESQSNQIDDVYDLKARKYRKLEDDSLTRIHQVSISQDGTGGETDTTYYLESLDMVRR